MNLIDKETKGKNGITLIALVITVIVMLILAGTTVTLTLSKRNILDDATITRDMWNNKVNNSASEINRMNNVLDTYIRTQ